MELIVNNKWLKAAVSTAFDVTGQEHLVIVTKASWRIPAEGQRPKPIEATNFCYSDKYTGESGLSAMVYGNDFALHKPACDIIFDACAHSATPVKELMAGFQLGSIKKAIRIHGIRYWKPRLGMLFLSDAEPFTKMPLHYDNAFGGCLFHKPGDENSAVDTYLINPIGTGWATTRTRKQLTNQRAASLEYPEDVIKSALGNHRPAALGAIGSHWQQRAQFAGTMDEHWQKTIFPFLPEDFDSRFHQVAPEDQQMPYPTGGEQVVLINLMENRSRVEFQLPAIGVMPVRVLRKNYSSELLNATADTLFFETEKKQLSVVWRTRLPIQKNIREFSCVAVGKISPEWWRQRSLGTSDCVTCGKNKSQEVVS
ncbi:DUF2169 family type VI secretion system accessory protein [Cellvibrio sp.]